MSRYDIKDVIAISMLCVFILVAIDGFFLTPYMLTHIEGVYEANPFHAYYFDMFGWTIFIFTTVGALTLIFFSFLGFQSFVNKFDISEFQKLICHFAFSTALLLLFTSIVISNLVLLFSTW